MSIMPNNTVYFTIVREPSSLFESLYVYVNMEKVSYDSSSVAFICSRYCTLNNIKIDKTFIVIDN